MVEIWNITYRKVHKNKPLLGERVTALSFILQKAI